jgi:surface polysaccharide O-acyltransferase-like enzyme
MTEIESRQPSRIHGFDYLRSIACIFVVAFHVSPFLMQHLFARTLHVFLFAAAVPIFILMSLFLTELRGVNKEYVVRKNYRIGKIYILWGWIIPSIVQLFFMKPPPNLSQSNIHDLIFNGPNWTLKVHGIYFLGFLFILTWAFLFLNPKICSYKKAFRVFLVFSMINIVLPFVPNDFDLFRHSLIPFLIYIPLAKMIAIDYRENENLRQRSLLFFCTYIPIALMEGILLKAERWSFLPTFHFLFHYSPYGRISIPLLAASIVYASLLIDKSLPIFSKTLSILCECSLGIYLVHGFLMDFLDRIGVNLLMPIPFLIVMSMSILLTCLIKDIPYLRDTIAL